MRAIVRLCIEKMDTPICSKQARRRFLPRRERRGFRVAIMVIKFPRTCALDPPAHPPWYARSLHLLAYALFMCLAKAATNLWFNGDRESTSSLVAYSIFALSTCTCLQMYSMDIAIAFLVWVYSHKILYNNKSRCTDLSANNLCFIPAMSVRYWLFVTYYTWMGLAANST